MTFEEILADIRHVGREWPDGVHTCEELQRLEPGRRPCTCGRCSAGDDVPLGKPRGRSRHQCPHDLAPGAWCKTCQQPK